MLTNKQKTILHVAKSRLGLDEDTYRDALEAHGGARSSSKLDYRGFVSVMRHFERCGFAGKVEGRRLKAEGNARPGMASGGQIKKIYALWYSLGPSYYTIGKELASLRGFLKKRFRVDHENFLRHDTAYQVIEAIKKIQGRQTGGR